jgi:dihydroxy-acid dehydratase
MLYAAGVPSREAMKKQPHVGIASVWWEGNPCKSVYPTDVSSQY